MQPQTDLTEYQTQGKRRAGGRAASEALRQSLELCGDFAGLEADANRYDLLLLVKKVGKLAGFTPRSIVLLDYYLAYTRDCDWEQGSRPIVYQSLSRTALDLGVSERQIQKLEALLFDLGAITWNDSGNHKRYGQRDPETGRLVYAFGVDLTPLAFLRTELERKLHEKRLYDDAWLEAKRQISWHRRQIKAILLEIEQGQGASSAADYEGSYAEIATQIRTHLTLDKLRALLDRHMSLYSDLMARVRDNPVKSQKPTQRASIARETIISSCKNEQEFAHYKYTTQPLNSCSRVDPAFRKSVVDAPAAKSTASSLGAEHVSLPMAVGAASDRLAVYLPPDPGWTDFIDAANRLRPALGISQASWGEACHVLGRSGAAICLLVTDRATERIENPVRQPAAYFRGMTERGRAGELRLHNSVFGLLRPNFNRPHGGPASVGAPGCD